MVKRREQPTKLEEETGSREKEDMIDLSNAADRPVSLPLTVLSQLKKSMVSLKVVARCLWLL